jgi:hypothetical protein
MVAGNGSGRCDQSLIMGKMGNKKHQTSSKAVGLTFDV